MPNYTVETIVSTTPNVDQYGNSRTVFTTGGNAVYMTHQPKNTPTTGSVLDGTVAPDRAKNLKFTKTPWNPDASQAPAPVTAAPQPPTAPSTQAAAGPRASTYKADPDKMKQEFSLEKARNMSIQRQVAAKGAIDLVVAGKVEYNAFYQTYAAIMHLLSEPDWEAASGVNLLGHDRIPLDELADADLEPGALFDRAMDKAEAEDYSGGL